MTRIAVGERGVHVEMGVDEWRRDQLSGRVDFCRGRGVQLRLDRLDRAVAHPYVDACAAVRQRRAANDQVHRSPPIRLAPRLDRRARDGWPFTNPVSRPARGPVPRITKPGAVCRPPP